MSNAAIYGLTQTPVQDEVYGGERNPQPEDLINVVYPEGIARAVFDASWRCKRSRNECAFALGEANFGSTHRGLHCISEAAGTHPNLDIDQPCIYDIATTIVANTSQDLKEIVKQSFAKSNTALQDQQTDQYGRTSAVFVDQDTGIKYYIVITDTAAKQGMQQMGSNVWDASDPRFLEPEIQIRYKGEDPTQWPNGIPYEGVVPTAETIQNTAKVHARFIDGIAAELGIDTGNDSFVWDQDRVPKSPWVKHELGATLETLTTEELNKTILDLLFNMENDIYSPSLLTPNGLKPQAKKFLEEIEERFAATEYFLFLRPKDKALLCVGLMLKALDQGTYIKDRNKFIAKSDPDIGKVTWRRYGESGRDRCEFIEQQNRKFKYQLDQNEVAHYTLLHAIDAYYDNGYSHYENLQSHNLEKVEKEWRPADPANITLADLINLNRQLLEGLLPDRNLGQLRQTREMVIKGRKPHPEPEEIEGRVDALLSAANDLLEVRRNAHHDVTYTKKNLTAVLNLWVDFDNIHPFEEGNGRTGTLFFRYMCKKVFGDGFDIDFPRSESRELSHYLGLALDSHRPDISALLDYVYTHSTIRQPVTAV